MSIFKEISRTLDIKLKKYSGTELPPEDRERLNAMLLDEAVTETLFSAKTVRRCACGKSNQTN